VGTYRGHRTTGRLTARVVIGLICQPRRRRSKHNLLCNERGEQAPCEGLSQHDIKPSSTTMCPSTVRFPLAFAVPGLPPQLATLVPYDMTPFVDLREVTRAQSPLPSMRELLAQPPPTPPILRSKNSSSVSTSGLTKRAPLVYKSVFGEIDSMAAQGNFLASLEQQFQQFKPLHFPVSPGPSDDEPTSPAGTIFAAPQYQLNVLQHPTRVRCCGLGDKGTSILPGRDAHSC